MHNILLALFSTSFLAACSQNYDKDDQFSNNTDNDNDQDNDNQQGSTDDQSDNNTADPADIDDDSDGFTENQGDCDDDNDTVNPDAEDILDNGIDEDCDGVDSVTPAEDIDNDGDGFTENQGDCNDSDSKLTPADNDGDGQSSCDGDCNDEDSDIHAGDHEDIPYDGIDSNCDGESDYDVDGDGHDHMDHGGDDCNDNDETLWDVCPPFTTYEVDACIDCPGVNAIAVDSAGEAYVLYEDAGVFYTNHRDGDGNWSGYSNLHSSIPALDDVGIAPSYGLDMTIDNADRIHASFTAEYDDGTGLLFILRDSAGNWLTDVYEVDGPTTTENMDVGYYVSMDTDSNNMPAFSYYDANRKLPFLKDTENNIISTLTGLESVQAQLDFFIDPFNSGFFAGTHMGMAIDSQDRSHSIFYNEVLTRENQYSAVMDIISLNIENFCYNDTVVSESRGIFNSVAIKSDDTVCVAYMNSDTNDLHYACNTGSCAGWSVETVDTNGSVGWYASLAFNSQDEPYIAYHDATNTTLKVAVKRNDAWELMVVDGENGTDVGAYSDIAIDHNDQVHISYADSTNGAIRYATGN